MPMSSKLIADYVEMINHYLDRIPVNSIQDFNLIHEGLQNILNGSAHPPLLTSARLPIRESLEAIYGCLNSPELYVSSQDNFTEYKNIIRARIISKIDQIQSIYLQQQNGISQSQRSNARNVRRNHQRIALSRAMAEASNAHTSLPLTYEQYRRINLTRENILDDLQNIELSDELREMFSRFPDELTKLYLRNVNIEQIIAVKEDPIEIATMLIRVDEVIDLMAYHNFADIAAVFTPIEGVDVPLTYEDYFDDFGIYNIDIAVATHHRVSILLAGQRLSHDMENVPLSDELREMFSRYPDELTQLYLHNVDIQQIIAVRENSMEIAAMLICVDEVIALMEYSNFADIGATFTPRAMDAIDVPTATQMMNDLL